MLIAPEQPRLGRDRFCENRKNDGFDGKTSDSSSCVHCRSPVHHGGPAHYSGPAGKSVARRLAPALDRLDGWVKARSFFAARSSSIRATAGTLRAERLGCRATRHVRGRWSRAPCGPARCRTCGLQPPQGRTAPQPGRRQRVWQGLSACTILTHLARAALPSKAVPSKAAARFREYLLRRTREGRTRKCRARAVPVDADRHDDRERIPGPSRTLRELAHGRRATATSIHRITSNVQARSPRTATGVRLWQDAPSAFGRLRRRVTSSLDGPRIGPHRPL